MGPAFAREREGWVLKWRWRVGRGGGRFANRPYGGCEQRWVVMGARFFVAGPPQNDIWVGGRRVGRRGIIPIQTFPRRGDLCITAKADADFGLRR